ncbi:MAG: glycosyltransferase [Muribaculaceae bacterium]|nr:glycosyltransferase [Muribaculaceae bacterium]
MKTKILIIHNSMDGGGAERVLASILNRLDRKRFSITLMLIYGSGVFMREIPDDIETLCLYKSPYGLPHRLLTHFRGPRNRSRLRRAERLLAGRRFDAIISFMEGPAVKLHQMLSHHAERNLSWVHTDLEKYRWYDFWLRLDEERDFYRSVRKIAFVSEDARRAFLRAYDTPAKLEVIYNPVDTTAIRAQAGEDSKPDGSPFTIVHVGRLVAPKRQERLIQAARILKDRGCRFHMDIVGQGPKEKELKALAAELGVEDLITFTGFMTNPFPLIRRADVFCLTSESEGFGMVVAEALSLDTPVVSTAVTGVKEILSHGGGLLTGDTPEEIADALESLIRNPERLTQLREQTDASAAQFGIEAVMEQIARFIED